MEQEFVSSFLSFSAQSPSPYHTVENLAALLRAKGFVGLNETAELSSLDPGSYFIVYRQSCLAAFSLSDTPLVDTGLRMVGAHCDSPALKLKPNPQHNLHGYDQLGVEVYGAPLISTWFDRDLSLAGRVGWIDRQNSLRFTLLDWQNPVAMIPSLAIHLNRKNGGEGKVDRQKELLPVLAMAESLDWHDFVASQISKEYPGAEPVRIVGHDLFFYDHQPVALVGMNRDFICGSRLDNQLSCFAAVGALLQAEPGLNSLVIINDHEEIGSLSAVGARGSFLVSLMERLLPSMEDRVSMINKSFFISLDNAHGLHPNYAEKHDADHLPLLNKGVVLKWNGNQKYATDGVSGAVFKLLCDQSGVTCQDFVMTNNIPCGSTIGPAIAAATGVKTVDVGVPTWAMHSIRETAGRHDLPDMFKVVKKFFSFTDLLPDSARLLPSG